VLSDYRSYRLNELHLAHELLKRLRPRTPVITLVDHLRWVLRAVAVLVGQSYNCVLRAVAMAVPSWVARERPADVKLYAVNAEHCDRPTARFIRAYKLLAFVTEIPTIWLLQQERGIKR
jgi:hypothetical protein